MCDIFCDAPQKPRRKTEIPMKPSDHTVVFDDFLRECLQCCSACGRTGPRLRHLTWSCAAQETKRSLTLAAVVCERCMHQPDYWARLDVQYRQRYGFDLDGRVEVTRSKGTP